MTTAFITHGDYLRHEMGPDHPECPARIGAITQYLATMPLADQLQWQRAITVNQTDLERIHPATYIHHLESLQPQQGIIYADPDTALNCHTLHAARLAAGAVTQATELVLNGERTNAFCAVRPPGHHAEHATAMGFCFFNNIAIGAAHALAQPGIERVAILDFDVHHCNGTIDSFKDRPEVLVCSTFQHPFYPLRYYDIKRPNIVNCPLPAGTGSHRFRQTVTERWLPALKHHQPQMIFVSAGFDAHKDDPLADLCLDEADFRWVSEFIVDAAGTYANHRVVSTLEGGYHLTALARSVYTHLDVLASVSNSAS